MEKMFSKKQLIVLMLPLVAEQFLAFLVGLIDSLMVASVGEVAVSAVSLVDTINMLIIALLSAMATGGAVVISQYMGRNDIENANTSAKQLIYAMMIVTLLITSLSVIFNRPLLGMLFGSVEEGVMKNSSIYFYVTAFSFPFLGLYNGGAAIFRSIGNSRISMIISIYMNIINVIGNAVFIYICKWGVFGAALATLLSRFFASVAMMILVCRKKYAVHIEKLFEFKLKTDMLKRIFSISIPNGIENSVFHMGKILVVSIASTLGTAAVAAHSVSSTVVGLACIPGTAMGLGIITVIGQCMGAGDTAQAEYYTKYLIKWTQLVFISINIVLMFVTPSMVGLYNISDEASQTAINIIYLHNILSGPLWPLCFTLPCALRAVGDAKRTMIISILSMWICRVLMAYVFVFGFNLGIEGIWLAFYVDWITRSSFFVMRFKSGKWKKNKVI